MKNTSSSASSKPNPPKRDPQAGIWHSRYRYPSSTRLKVFEGEHFVRLQRAGKQWVLESLPNVSKSYLILRLTVTDGIATGTWQEQTDPDGYYKGVIYHGAIQLVVDDDGRRMQGKWLGYSNDLTINVGSWEFDFVGKTLPARLSAEA